MTAGISLHQVIVAADALERPEIRSLMNLVHERGIASAAASAPVMAAVSPARSPTDLVGIAARPASDPSRVFASAVPLVIVAADVQDPGNLGAMVRVAEAAGADGMLVTGQSADPFGWKALRGSMGSALRLPTTVMVETRAAVEASRKHGCRIVATVPRGGQSAFAVDLRQPVALLLGGEGGGLPPGVIQATDLTVTIPMNPPVESLNVAIATALLMYEARRQRQGR